MYLHGPKAALIAPCARRQSAQPSRRAARALLPQTVELLEERALLSGAILSTHLNEAPAILARAFHHDSAGGQGPTQELNVPYPTGNGGTERLNVYMPAGDPPVAGRPVLIAIHGGGWRRLDKDGYGSRIASAFVPLGYVVVAPNYVLSKPGKPTWPVNFADVQAAVTWVRAHANTLGINPDQIAAIGESAGANLAALLGTASGPNGSGGGASSVQAVVAFSTPTDLTTLSVESPLAGRAAAQFLGGTPEQVPANYVAASPIDHVSPGDPPMFLVQGRQDPLIPESQSVQMEQALESAGVTTRLVRVNGGHDLDFPEHYANLIHQILEFLDATWKDG
jgi:acetyl esterase/lipase